MATEKQIIKLINTYVKASKKDLKQEAEPCTTKEMSLYLLHELELIKTDIKRINNGELRL